MARSDTAGSAWTQEQIAAVERLWNEGLTAARIAIEISRRGPPRTKNAVLGLVHRRGLVARPSPIPTTRGPRSPRTRKPAPAPKHTLPVITAAQPGPDEPAAQPGPDEPAADHVAPRPRIDRMEGARDRTTAERSMDTILGHARRQAAPPALQAPMASIPLARHRTCQWPEGEPGTEGFRLCGDPAVLGKPYCPEHCTRAFAQPREKNTA